MTDFADGCAGCGGHLRANVYSGGPLCPKCEVRRDAGEMDNFGRREQALTNMVERELRATIEMQRRVA